MLDAFLHLVISHPSRWLTSNENKIDVAGDLIPVKPNDFLHHTPKAVPHDRIADLLADRNAQTEMAQLRLAERIQHELLVGRRFAEPVHFTEIFSFC